MPADTNALHVHAVQAEKHLEQLATGLAEVGAPEPAVKAVSSAAELARKVATGLAQSMKNEPAPEQQPEAAPAAPARTMGEATDRMMG